jgi:hypothetical protein
MPAHRAEEWCHLPLSRTPGTSRPAEPRTSLCHSGRLSKDERARAVANVVHLPIGNDRRRPWTILSTRVDRRGPIIVEWPLEDLNREIQGARGELLEQLAQLGDTLFEGIGITPLLNLLD